MAGIFEQSPSVTPSPTTCSSSGSGFDWPSTFDNNQAQGHFHRSGGFDWPLFFSNQAQGHFHRSVSDQQTTPTSRRQQDSPLYNKWGVALRCKQNVGTQEWINCKQLACLQLRDELHHLLECRYRHIGGCKGRCMRLREELQEFQNLLPKYPTITELQAREILENDELQAKLQAFKIHEYVENSTYSPTSPNVEEPFQLLARKGQRSNKDQENLVHVEELIPLDQAKLSVSNGCFRKGYEWVKICFLGKGAFGSTYLCFDKLRHFHFAIKKVPVSNFEHNETNLWRRLSGKHPNILDLYGAIIRKERVLIFMEYMKGGSVADYLAKYGALNETMALKILQQVLSGLNFMHRLCIIHGDIKAANILMDHLGLNIKLADFGSSIDLNSIETSGRSLRLVGTLAFMAPEVCRSESPLPSSDIWSAMCLLIQMLSAEAPWEEYRHQGTGLLFVIGSAKRPPTLPRCSESVQEIFARGLNVIAYLRPTAAELLGHFVFNSIDQDVTDGHSGLFENEYDSFSDDSTEYHSSHSGELDTSGEYFSSQDADVLPSTRAEPTNIKRTKAKRIDNTGGELKITNAQVIIPTEALQDNTKISIKSIAPTQLYQTIIDHDIQDKVTVLGDVYKLRPSGLIFQEYVLVKVTLQEALHQSEDVTVLHGTLNKDTNKYSWEEIEKTLLPFSNSSTVTVNINHFSALAVVKSIPSFAYEGIASYFNFQGAFFRFIVLVRRDTGEGRRLHIRIVVVRDSFYQNSCEKLFEDYYVCRKLKEEGFCDMFGSRREYIGLKEDIDISIEGFMGDRVCTSKRYTVQGHFGGEIIASWDVDECWDSHEPLSGTVVMKRTAGQKYRFQFWQHEPTRYVQNVLELTCLRYTNMLPLARALELDQGEVNDLVEKTEGDEEQQLKMITEIWNGKAENNELPILGEFVASVPRQAFLISDRGKSHLGHLSEFRQKWNRHKTNSETPPLGDDMYLKTMARNGESLCQSVFSDCLLQTDHSDRTVRFVSRRDNLDMESVVMKRVSEMLEQHYPRDVVEKLNKLVVAFESYDHDRCNSELCERFCRQLIDWIPWFMQVVRDCFEVHPVTEPTGLWGLSCETDPHETIQEKKHTVVLREIAKLLKNLCEKNSTNSDDLEHWYRTLSFEKFLENLPVTHKEWLCLAARIRYYYRFMSSDELSQDRIHQQDLGNLLNCLRKYVSFCPTRLVQFSFSIDNVHKETLCFEESDKIFTQKCVVSMENSTLELGIKVEVCIHGATLSAEVDITLTRCEQQDDSHGECSTLIVKYLHQEHHQGYLIISNECESLYREHRVTVPVELEETDSNSNVCVKEGCPNENILNEIAREVTEVWKPLGRLLLSSNAISNINIIDQDERGVLEKTTAMFEKWKQTKASEATYRELYTALVNVTVNRKDIAERFCLDKCSPRSTDTVL